MTLFLRRLVLFLSAAIFGFVFSRYLMPIVAIDILGGHMPIGDTFAALLSFGHYAFIRPLLIWAAATIAALVGFIPLRCGSIARGVILTLPASAPILYGLLFLITHFRA